MITKESILTFLDQAFERINMPCLGNMNIDYLANRLSIYHSADKWIMLFNSVVWWPAAEGIMTTIETVGTGALGKQGFDNNRTYTPAKIDLSDMFGDIISIRIRDKIIDHSALRITPNYDLEPDYEFWIAVSLLEKYDEHLFATTAELARFIPEGFQHLLTIDEWDHPDWDTPPSATETFPRLADIILSGDASLWQAARNPNTHWSNWLPK
jgi:hypothetical protein